MNTCIILTTFLDKIQQATKLLIRELQPRILCSPPHWENTKQTPIPYAKSNKQFSHLMQQLVVVGADTCYHIPQYIPTFRQQSDSLGGTNKTLRVSSHPIMLVLKPIKTHSDTMQTTLYQSLQTTFFKYQSVGDDTPRKTTVIYFASHRLQIITQQYLTTAYDNKDMMRVNVRGDSIENMQKIISWHIWHLWHHLTVTPTMPTA